MAIRQITKEGIDDILRQTAREISDEEFGSGELRQLADDMIETGLPARWGFDGIGPLRFRDMEDLMTARKAIDERLYLIGSLAVPSGLEGSQVTGNRSTGIMLTSKPTWRAQLTSDEHDLLSESPTLFADTGDSPTE